MLINDQESQHGLFADREDVLNGCREMNIACYNRRASKTGELIMDVKVPNKKLENEIQSDDIESKYRYNPLCK
jgi:hypothetical protein